VKFRQAWSRWLEHRRQIRKPLKPATAATQLQRFVAWGQARAIVAIEHTLFNGWIGLREPDELANDKPEPASPRVLTPEEMRAL
jgi:hypothetical protein